jgi:hypothetical protein
MMTCVNLWRASYEAVVLNMVSLRPWSSSRCRCHGVTFSSIAVATRSASATAHAGSLGKP